MKKEEKNKEIIEEIISDTKEEISSKEEKKEKSPKSKEDLRKEFSNLIKGEFKEVYEEKIKENLSKRFKENEALKAQLEDAKEILSALSGRYSIEPGDMESLKNAVNADDELFEKEAEKQGLDVKNYRYLKNLERENEAYKKFFEKERLEKQAADTMKEWYDMSETLAKEYPDFNISKEAENPKFIALIKAGVDLKTAYEAIHYKDILDLAKEDAASKARKEATREFYSREARPEENGLSARSSAIIKTDVSKLSAKDRAEIAKRVAKGEKISF